MKTSICRAFAIQEMSPPCTRSPKLRRVRVRSPSLRPKSFSNSIECDQKVEFVGMEGLDGGSEKGNKVMVVVDSSFEAKGALEWALSHTVQSQVSIVLLYVSKPSKPDSESNSKVNLRAYELLHSMKAMCQRKRPGVEVDVVIREGKEKGPTIVEEAKEQKVRLLVLGQRKESIMWRLMKRMAGRRRKTRGGAVNYCIQNASCMTIGVRRKGRRLGGYLITTKCHKNFWLLA